MTQEYKSEEAQTDSEFCAWPEQAHNQLQQELAAKDKEIQDLKA